MEEKDDIFLSICLVLEVVLVVKPLTKYIVDNATIVIACVVFMRSSFFGTREGK